MRTLRGLIVDDEEENSDLIKQRLNLEFEKLRCKVTWETPTSAVAAMNLVRDEAAFHFAILDLYLNTLQMQDGMDVARHVYEKDSRTFSLLVTSYGGHAPDFRSEAAEYCTHAIGRDELLRARQWRFERLAAEILHYVTLNGLLDTGHVSFNESDVSVRGMLTRIGASTVASWNDQDADNELMATGQRIVRNLSTLCLDIPPTEDVSIAVAYLAAGKSGAEVCLIDVKRPNRQRRSFVLKLSFNRNMLERELAANERAQAAIGEQGLVAIAGKVRSDASGYYGMAARVAHGTVPLRDWLSRPSAAENAAGVANVLLGELVGGLFSVEARQQVATAEWLAPTDREASRGLDTLRRYLPALGSEDAAGRRGPLSVRLIRQYVEERQFPLPVHVALANEVVFVYKFGDLHSRNILVPNGPQPRPVLVDAARFGSGHWAEDAAQLVVDLTLKIRKAGLPAMLWNKFEESYRYGLRLCPRRHSSSEALSASADAFLHECVLNLVRYTHAVELGVNAYEWHWQWHAALAKEFLRQAWHDDLSPVRGTLALRLADAHLRFSIACMRRGSRFAVGSSEEV